eukprot:Rhum_TRINITY_DN3264_c0_g1::Rhum_TRINITY_DN3264_c0_g1_i1::g.10042::m.10042
MHAAAFTTAAAEAAAATGGGPTHEDVVSGSATPSVSLSMATRTPSPATPASTTGGGGGGSRSTDAAAAPAALAASGGDGGVESGDVAGVDLHAGAAGEEMHGVGLRDIASRLFFSFTARVMYITCVVLAAGLVLVSTTSGDRGQTMEQSWYQALEGVLTFLFAVEVGVKAWLTRLRGYLTPSERWSLAELVICVLCVLCFVAMLAARATAPEESRTESFVGAVLISARYLFLLARLLFLVRSTRSVQAAGPSDVRLHPLGNAGISIGSPRSRESPSGNSSPYGDAGSWDSGDAFMDVGNDGVALLRPS